MAKNLWLDKTVTLSGLMMSKHYEHNIKDHEDPSAGYTWMIGLVGTVLLVVTVLATVALYYNVQASQNKESVIEPTRIDVKKLRAKQLQVLSNTPHWFEGEEESGEIKRYLAIPIDRAIQLVIEQHGGAQASAFDMQGD